MLVEVNPEYPEPRKIRRAVETIEGGGVIAYPTDTAYGLGCDLLNKKAIERLYQIKGLDRSHKLSFVCQGLADVSRYAVMHDHVFQILRKHLPGPYTFVLEATRDVPKMIQTARKAVGIRVPDHAVVMAITRELGRPIISTTACRPGEAPTPDPAEIDAEFRGLSLVLDAGPGGTVPSSIIDITGPEPRIIRVGAGDVEPFEA